MMAGTAAGTEAPVRSHARRAVLTAVLAGAALVAVALLAAGARQLLDRPAASSTLGSRQQAAALVSAGLRYQASNQPAQAMADYNEALGLDPANRYARYNRGVLYQAQGENALAAADYRRAIAIDPRFENALFNLAVLVAPGDPAQAVQLYRRVIALDSRNAEAHLNLGFALRAEGDAAAATAEFKVAVALKPELGRRIPAS